MHRCNPLIEEQREDIKQNKTPEYSFEELIQDLSNYASNIAVTKNSQRALQFNKEEIVVKENSDLLKKYILKPHAGRQGEPVKIYKFDTKKEYDFNSNIATLFKYTIFAYVKEDYFVLIFYRTNGSGCKTVFLEAVNSMLKQKGIKLDMSLYVPKIEGYENASPTKVTMQQFQNNTSTDKSENLSGNKRRKLIKETTFVLSAVENYSLRTRIKNKINSGTADDKLFIELAQETGLKDYNDAVIELRIGKRNKKIKINDFDSMLGSYDITDRLHDLYGATNNFEESLSTICDEYYKEISEAIDNDN